MIEKNYKIISSRNRLLTLLAGLVVIFLTVACAGGNYGSLDRDRELDNMYLNYEVIPEHRYYITGGYAAPKAILAIHRNYVLDNPGSLWVPVPNVDSVQMQKWVDTIAPDMNFRGSGAYYASYILDPSGKRVGVWYAIETFTTVKFLEGNRIQVYPPDGKQYNLDGGGNGRGFFSSGGESFPTRP